MCTATPIVYNPRTRSRASSLAMRLSPGAVLDIFAMLRRAYKESDRTLASTAAGVVFVPNHILHATRIARASHVVLNAESPLVALKRRRSASDNGQANQAEGLPAANRTPPMPHGHASVAM